MSISRFWQDQRGLAAVEFALIGPLLIALLFGAVAAFDLFKADRATSHAANIVVDLLSRQETMDDATRDALFATGQALIGSFGDETSYAISLTSIFNDGDDLEVVWSEANTNGNILTDDDIASLDLPTIPPNESVVFIRVTNDYAPIFGQGLTFSRDSSRRPRFVASIAYDD